MNVKMSRRDFPLLTDEIARLPKGPRRTNRLAQLATLGLCWERAVAGMDASLCDGEHVVPLAVPATGREHRGAAYCSRLDAGHIAALLDGDDQ
jgi:hypothetical protein